MEKTEEDIKKIQEIIGSHMGEKIYIEYVSSPSNKTANKIEGVVHDFRDQRYVQLWCPFIDNGEARMGLTLHIPISLIFYIASEKCLDGVVNDSFGKRYIGSLYEDPETYYNIHEEQNEHNHKL